MQTRVLVSWQVAAHYDASEWCPHICGLELHVDVLLLVHVPYEPDDRRGTRMVTEELDARLKTEHPLLLAALLLLRHLNTELKSGCTSRRMTNNFDHLGA